jgi:hypothetical protein
MLPDMFDLVITHANPVWATRADSVVLVDLKKWGLSGVEELPSHHVGGSFYELCCVPFFSYGMKLGDVVEATPNEYDAMFVAKVIKSSNRLNIRLAVRSEKETDAAMRRILGILARAECGFEMWQPGYVAADVPTPASETIVLRGLQVLVDHELLSIERI